MTTWTRRPAMILATAIVLAACGGGGEEDAVAAVETTLGMAEDSGDTSSSVAPSGEGEGAGEEGGEDTNGEVDESQARVTIDGTIHEFGENGPAATCNPNFFGGFFVVLYTEDSTGHFEAELWNEGTGEGRPVKARMTAEVDGTEVDLVADPEQSFPAAEEGSSMVESFTYGGNSAEGTISFIDTNVAYNADLFPLDPVIADFEVVCAP